MKSTLFLACFLLSSALSCFSQNETETRIIGKIHTGENAEKTPQKSHVKRDYVIKSTSRQKIGDRNVTVHEVEPPVMKKEEAPSIQRSTRTKPVTGNTESRQAEETKLISLFATVYGKGDKKITRLTLLNQGKVCEAWVNFDGNELGGFSGFKANGREYVLLFGSSDALSKKGDIAGVQVAAKNGCPLNHRVFKLRRANFVVTKIEDGDIQSREILGDVCKLYRKERQRLKLAYEARKRNFASGKNASEKIKPKDVTIRFWKRDLEKEKKERRAK